MLFFNPSTLGETHHVVNAASVISVSTQNQSSLSLSEGSNSQLVNSKGTLSHIPGATAPSLIAQATTSTSTSNTSKCGSGTPRDKNTWPFTCDSIWNMPIGSSAQYVDANIGSKGVGSDIDWFITTKDSDPAVPTYMSPT